jgi:translation initiation factor IF-1
MPCWLAMQRMSQSTSASSPAMLGAELMVVFSGQFAHFFGQSREEAHLVPVAAVVGDPLIDALLQCMNAGIGHGVLPHGDLSACAHRGASLPSHSMEVAVAADDLIDMEGTIAEVFPGGTFLVETEHGNKVQAHLAGKLRRYRIRVVLGDKVTVAVSPYDLTKGRITFRHK